MHYRRNLRDAAVILILAALVGGLSWQHRPPTRPTPTEPQASPDRVRLTIENLALGDSPTVHGTLSAEHGVTYGSTRILVDKSSSLVVRTAGNPESSIDYVEGVRLERNGLLIARPGTSRERVLSYLGRPDHTRAQPEDGSLEDLYLDQQLVVRYRGYQVQRVWMVSGAERWLALDNWPEALGDHMKPDDLYLR